MQQIRFEFSWLKQIQNPVSQIIGFFSFKWLSVIALMYSTSLYSLPTKNVMILHLSASAHGKTQRTTRVSYVTLDVAPRQSSAFMSEDHHKTESSNHVLYCSVVLSAGIGNVPARF